MENNSNQDSSSKKSPFDDLNREELITKCKGLLAIAQKSKQARVELNKEVAAYKTQLEQCETEKNVTLENVKTLQELVDSLTEQKLNYITEIDEVQSKTRVLNDKCNNYKEEIEKFKKDAVIKENGLAEATRKLSDLDNEVTSLKRQNDRLLKDNEQLLTQLTEMETKITEFNVIGLQQQQQLQKLEEKVEIENKDTAKINELNNKIRKLEDLLVAYQDSKQTKSNVEYENNIKELTDLYENEKAKKEKANVKLRSYKDKILKCAACINQLKNSRYILTKTVKDYSESIPRWQNDIIKASKVLDSRVIELNSENSALKQELKALELQLNETLSSQNNFSRHVNKELVDQHQQTNIPLDIDELKNQIIELEQKVEKLSVINNELSESLAKTKNNTSNEKELIEKLGFQIKALESEKSTLVKEKLNTRDNVVELENQNKILTNSLNQLRMEMERTKAELDTKLQEMSLLEMNVEKTKNDYRDSYKNKISNLEEQNAMLKKEFDNLQDLNGLLKEEVETLKLSLEQPNDDTDNLSDLNVSLQADIVKLETKLSAYKQENSSLLTELKECRNKVRDYDSLVVEYEDFKSNYMNYKTENSELLHEMKEINQALKERGETISKLQKAIAEMETLIETLETERDNSNKEKDNLNNTIELLRNDLKNIEQSTIKNNDHIKERDNVLKVLEEKEAIIISLKDEIEKLKNQQISPAELPNEDMSTSTISKAEEHSRMKDLDETFEEKYTKLRMFALKLKKKLNDTTAQLQTALQDKVKIEKLLNDSTIDKKAEDVVDNAKGKSDKEITDLEAKVKSLTDTVEASQKISAELEKIKAELLTKTEQLTAEVEAHKKTKENLEKARRDVKKKNVLSLEMEDYERSMKELTTKMEDSKKKIVQMESTIDTQEGTINAMKTQIMLLEEQIKTEETQNRIIKEELQHAIEEGKEKDNVIQIKNDIILKYESDLEIERVKNEESNLEITQMLSEKEKSIMKLSEDKASLKSNLKKLELKCTELSEKLRITNIELDDLKSEYTSYKVRAQAVLRQNQTVDHSQEEQLKEETAALRTQIETLSAKLTTAEEQCAAAVAEAASVGRRAAEASGEATRAQQRTARMHADLTRLHAQLDSERDHHTLQITTLTQCYKAQISELETKLQKETEELKLQVTTLQEKMKAAAYDTVTLDDSNRNQYMLPVIPKEDMSDSEMDINVSMIPREEGEGSESAPSPPPSNPYLNRGGGRSPVPLDRLLEEGVPADEALDTASLALTPEQEISDLKRKLQAQQQRVKHITVLLSESERECARMSQLSELLKGELRRVRGPDHNTEYMKNVTLKFLTLPPGDERSRLVPVLQKILTLTNDETHKIHAIAKGLDPNPNRGWGSYLPWPGGGK